MRLTSEFVVAALTRRIFGDGGFAAIERKGAEAAGAIFIRQRHRDGTQTLYGPAPQSMLEEERPERQFEIRIDRGDADATDSLIARELKWDPDLWLVEIETDDAARYISFA